MVIKFLFKILMLKIEKTENKMSIGSDYVSDPISSLEGWLEVSGTLYLVGEWSNWKLSVSIEMAKTLGRTGLGRT